MYRKEQDGLGELLLPQDALYGIHSLRAKENFPIAHRQMDLALIDNITRVKKAAAIVNGNNGDLTAVQANAIAYACDEVLSGKHYEAFIVDAMQGGAGTSANMNANEVIANLAIRFLGGKPGEYHKIHPIDHVNMHQSTNDVIPTAGRLTVIQKCRRLLEVLERLHCVLTEKAVEFDDILKVGRTQLQDAVPMRVGQGFRAYAAMIKRSMGYIEAVLPCMQAINMGATAIGTGINVPTAYRTEIVPTVSRITGLELRRSEDLFDGTQNADEFAAISSAIKVCAIQLSKMAGDLRLLSSGPHTGLGDLILPAQQCGSSIMPGKVNPVIPEAMNQAAFLVVGHDATISVAAQAGQLELNAFLPVILYQLFEEIDIFRNAIEVFTEKCVTGIAVNKKRCETHLGKCYSIATALNPKIGYDKSAALVKSAEESGNTIVEIALEKSGLSLKELETLLEPHRLTGE